MVAPKNFAKGLAAEVEQEQRADLDRRAARKEQRDAVRDEHRASIDKRMIAELQTKLKDFAQLQASLDYLNTNPLKPHKIKRRERGKAGRTYEATAYLLLSDLHLEETVHAASVNGINAFDLEIAAQRMDALADGFVWAYRLASEGSAAYKIRDVVIASLGDITTNYLRAEDIQGNALTPMEALVFAQKLIVRFCNRVLVELPEIVSLYMPMVPGNHDRLAFSRSTPFTKRVGMSSMPVLAHGIATELKHDPRFRLEMSPAEHHYHVIYDHAIRCMHGDRFNFAGGVGGIAIPARRHIARLNRMRDAYMTVFGHWHTSKVDDNWTSNGSLIGPNEYSIGRGLDPEPPSQTMFLIDRDRGRRMVTPVQVSSVPGW